MQVLGEDAVLVLKRHIVTGEGHHTRAEPKMQAIQTAYGATTRVRKVGLSRRVHGESIKQRSKIRKRRQDLDE